MRPEHLHQFILITSAPRITLNDMERELRKVYRDDPDKAERVIGTLYGQIFKKKEALYDGIRIMPAPESE